MSTLMESLSTPSPVHQANSSKVWPALQTNGFVAALFCILVSELGDKTFVITTILAMKYSKKSVFLGALTAATLMISLSVMIGAMSSLVPAYLTHHFSILLFAFFGYQMLTEGLSMDKKAVNSDTKTSSSTSSPSASVEDEVQLEAMSAIKELEERDNSSKEKIIKFVPFVSLIFIETFTLNFFAEWGDKSQLATILLAAKDNVFGVASGAIFGQAICITLAVIGGQLMSKLVSIKTVTIIGGIGFVAFAILEFIF